MSNEQEKLFDPVPKVSADLNLDPKAVRAVVDLLAEGSTVPFIARYRKEATGGLEDVSIVAIQERSLYVRELDERRQTILKEIEKQGKLTEALRKTIVDCQEKARLEDLYLPYKPKRRTRAIIAKEKGLEPLADLIWAQEGKENPTDAARAFVNEDKGVADKDAALAGARDICAERISDDADIRTMVRETYAKEGMVSVGKSKDHVDSVTKFDMYASFQEPVANIPSHRFLAIRRGEQEGILRAQVRIQDEPMGDKILGRLRVQRNNPWGQQLELAARDALKRLIMPSVESDVRVELKLNADKAAVDVFALNLRQLLLAAPLGTKTVVGIDPGQRTGCKVAVVDDTGKIVDHTVLYLVQGDDSIARAKTTLRTICKTHCPAAIAVGNGTYGRETEAFVRDLLAEEGLKQVFAVSVSEAGASVYSASEIARQEFPDLDVTVRGAISIARRLQDPLAELVKIDPKSIGVGQYQHDVHQPMLARKLDQVVESCVNLVGVELNTASAPLLSRVAGLSATVAKRIVAHRDNKGAFQSRRQLLDVAGIGPRTYEQAAGFLRIRGAEHPLDASAVHPERYELVQSMAKDLGVPLADLVGNAALASTIDWRKYVSEDVGEPTLRDILAELAKPGRDPRDSFEPPRFRDDVRTMEDLVPGMELEGLVTNVTAFGAFVDVGVHQDGLVHVSKLADRFVRDPNEVVKVGDKIQVRVMEVDLQRKRISLSARKNDQPDRGGRAAQGQSPEPKRNQGQYHHQKGGPRTVKSRDDAKKFAHNPFAKLLKK
ncbi:MAG: RNA-binding transcriptional accessory protein [Sorangium cellulosum]|nr:MAG: RNA-binding transcriptional accessory protein [Sorangium cellulosum]